MPEETPHTLSLNPNLTPHGVEVCYWLREKPYIQEILKEMKEELRVLNKSSAGAENLAEDVAEIRKKLDSFTEKLAVAVTKGDEVGKLSEAVGLSKQDIAALKVKASLLGVASAAALEIIIVLLKYVKP